MEETSKARAAFEAYYALGPDRSLRKLAAKTAGAKSASTTRRKYDLRTLQTWSAAHDWQARVAERDRLQAEANAQAERERIAQIMATGYAQAHERVLHLGELATLLWKEIKSKNKRWLPDVKQVGQGEYAERVDIVRFNAALIEQFRKTLEDLAAETGGRPKKMELGGKDGGPIPVVLTEVVVEMPQQGEGMTSENAA